MSTPVICADCGSEMRLRPSKYGKFYGCVRYPQCKGTHGAHPDGRPLGKPATLETKRARIAAHDTFDRIWKLGPLTRKEAYAWLGRELGYGRAPVHMGEMELEECQRVVELVKHFWPTLFPAETKRCES